MKLKERVIMFFSGLILSFTKKDNMEVRIKLEKGVSLPVYSSEGAAGFDIKAHTFKKLYNGDREVNLKDIMVSAQKDGYIKIRPGERVLVGTGIYTQLPKNYVLDIRSRSGLSTKKGLTLINGVGTVDSDYRGEIMICLLNTTKFLVTLNLGDRVAQGLIFECPQVKLISVDYIDETERGEGGFGSTGN